MYYYEYNRPQDPEQSLVPSPPPGAPKKRRWPRVAALLLACAVLGGGAGTLGAVLTARSGVLGANAGETTIYHGEREPTVVSVSKINTGTPLTLSEIYASNVNSVVGINVDITTTNAFGQKVSQAASGSGFVITSDGYILTNYHVVEGANKIAVSFVDGSTYDAEYIGGEPDNDIAVLKIDRQGLSPVIIGNSSDMKVGEQVAAIGNPLGELTFSQTVGYISALDRNITTSDGKVMNLLQTDTAINSGNSGGPLFNIYGEVIGITNAKYSSTSSSGVSIEGIGFAIPVNDIIDMVGDIMEFGYVTGKPYMGITVSTALASEAQKYGRSGGAHVESVVSDSCAAKAGLKQGDIITKIGDTVVDSHATLISEKNKHKAGDTVTLVVDRDGSLITITITFDEAKPTQSTTQVTEEAVPENNLPQQNQGDYDSWPFWPYFR